MVYVVYIGHKTVNACCNGWVPIQLRIPAIMQLSSVPKTKLVQIAWYRNVNLIMCSGPVKQVDRKSSVA